MIVAGVGCRRGAPWRDIEALVLAALAAHGLARADLDALATETSKGGEPGIVETARRLSVALVSCAAPELNRVASAVLTPSARAQAVKGVPAVAEAAALVAAGRDARLLGPRIASGAATCAIAMGAGP